MIRIAFNAALIFFIAYTAEGGMIYEESCFEGDLLEMIIKGEAGQVMILNSKCLYSARHIMHLM